MLLSGSDAQITAKHLHERRVEEAMSHNPISVGIEASVEEVMQLMERHGIKRIPVVAEGKVIGIVSRANLLLAVTRRANRH